MYVQSLVPAGCAWVALTQASRTCYQERTRMLQPLLDRDPVLRLAVAGAMQRGGWRCVNAVLMQRCQLCRKTLLLWQKKHLLDVEWGLFAHAECLSKEVVRITTAMKRYDFLYEDLAQLPHVDDCVWRYHGARACVPLPVTQTLQGLSIVRYHENLWERGERLSRLKAAREQELKRQREARDSILVSNEAAASALKRQRREPLIAARMQVVDTVLERIPLPHHPLVVRTLRQLVENALPRAKGLQKTVQAWNMRLYSTSAVVRDQATRLLTADPSALLQDPSDAGSSSVRLAA